MVLRYAAILDRRHKSYQVQTAASPRRQHKCSQVSAAATHHRHPIRLIHMPLATRHSPRPGRTKREPTLRKSTGFLLQAAEPGENCSISTSQIVLFSSSSFVIPLII